MRASAPRSRRAKWRSRRTAKRGPSASPARSDRPLRVRVIKEAVRMPMISRLGRCLALTVVGMFLVAPPAQSAPTEEDLPPTKVLDIDPSGVQMLRVAVPRAEGDSGATAVETLSRDMDVSGLFQVLDPASFPAQLQSEGMNFSSALWTQVGAQVVVKMRASGGALEGKVFVVARGDQPTLSKSYRHADIRDAIHEFANDMMQSFTSKRGVFGSRIVF